MALAQDEGKATPQIAPPASATDVDDDAMAPEMTPISDAIQAAGDRAQALSAMDSIGADNLVMVSLADVGLSAQQRYTLAQQMDPSAEASLQQALSTAMVTTADGSQVSLADHLTALGVDPSSVVAAEIDNDGTVTLYTQ